MKMWKNANQKVGDDKTGNMGTKIWGTFLGHGLIVLGRRQGCYFLSELLLGE